MVLQFIRPDIRQSCSRLDDVRLWASQRPNPSIAAAIKRPAMAPRRPWSGSGLVIAVQLGQTGLRDEGSFCQTLTAGAGSTRVQLVTQTIRWHSQSAPRTPLATAVGCANTAVIAQPPAASIAAAAASAIRLRRDDESVMPVLLWKRTRRAIAPRCPRPCELGHNRPTTIAWWGRINGDFGMPCKDAAASIWMEWR